MARGKVITTHLRTGDPNGIRTVFISNKICEMIVFPKSEFEMVSKMEESSRPALYILLGEDENGSAQAYIGESTNGVKRIYNHKSHIHWLSHLREAGKNKDEERREPVPYQSARLRCSRHFQRDRPLYAYSNGQSVATKHGALV